MNTLADLNALSLPALFEELSKDGQMRRLIELARDEDLGLGEYRDDITSLAWHMPEDFASAMLVSRSACIVGGLAALPMLVQAFAPRTSWKPSATDGERLEPGRVLGELLGPSREVLALERTMLNIISRLSGVATLTSRYVAEAALGSGSTPARVYDTRKTTPGLRLLEKYAVRCGGGFCHRLGLYDAVLIKDNHLAAARKQDLVARLVEVSRRARSTRPLRFVEAEADTLEQFETFLSLPADTLDVVLLDNMTPDQLRRAVEMRADRRSSIVLEASGGVSLGTIKEIAATGVDRISAGAITHGATWADIGLDF